MLLGLPRLKSFRRFSPHRFLALSPLPLLPSVIARAAGAADPEGFLASLLGPGSLRPAVYPALANLLGRAATRPFASPIPFAVEPGIKSANQADIRALCPNGPLGRGRTWGGNHGHPRQQARVAAGVLSVSLAGEASSPPYRAEVPAGCARYPDGPFGRITNYFDALR